MDEKKENALQAAEEGVETPAEELPAEVEATEEDDDSPVPDMVFGLRRRTFHLVVVGYALGVIVVSLLGLAGLYPEDSGTMIPGVIGAALGYALATYLDRRDGAKQDKESGESKK